MGEMTDPICVLHVDDDPDLADMVATFLEREDHRIVVQTATNAATGLDMLDDLDVDCIVSDFDMPGQNGIEFLETVRDEYPTLPFILYTGKGSEEVASEAISAGVTDYLQKEGGTDQYTVLANRLRNAVERYRAEQARDRQREAIETAREGISILNEDGEFIYVNRRYADLYGYEPEEMLGEHWELIYPSDDVAVARDEILPTVAEEGYWHGETTGLRADGTTFPEDHVVSQTANDELVCTVRDLSDRRERETELRMKTRAMDEAPAGITISDPTRDDNPLIYVNNRFVELTGYGEEIIGQNCRILQGKNTASEPVTRMREAIDAEEPVTVQLRNYRKDGTEFWSQVSIAPVYDEDGSLVNYVGFQQNITEEKELQQELEQTNTLLSTLFEALPQGVLVEDESRNMITVNQRMFDLFELPGLPEEVVGADCECMAESVRDMFEHSEQFLERINDLIAERGPVDGEELALADGRTFERTYRPIELPDSEGHLWMYRDITGRKTHERELETVQRQFNAVLENTTTPMFMKDDEGRYIFVNQAYRDLFNLQDEEIVGRTDHEIHSPEMAVEVQTNDQAVLEHGEPIETEERIVVDGDERIFLSTKVPIYDTGKRSDPDTPVAIFGVATDITERNAHEKQLESLNRIAQELMSADTRDEVLEIGVETTRDLLGIEANSIHLYDEYADALVPAMVTDAVRELVGEPPTFTGEDSIAWRVYQQGETLAVDDVHEEPDRYNSDTPIRSELFLPLGKYGILLAGSPFPETFDEQDVLLGEILAGGLTTALEQVERTEQLRTRERELTKQNDRLEQFTSFVSHDLRNPLSVASGRLELAAAECDSEHLEHVKQAHERMQVLVEDLLALAREGEAVSDFDPIALDSLVEECWTNVETGEAGLAIDTDRTVQADESRLKQLFENLMRNAIEHGGEDVTVTIGELDDGFYIEDDGPGIPADERESIFEAGYSTREEGTGFGLSIVKQIVDAHDWDIRVTDGSERGARFEVTGVEFT